MAVSILVAIAAVVLAVVGVVYGLGAIAFVLRAISGFRSCDVAEIKSHISDLLRSGFKGSYLAVYNRENPDLFLGFRKYIHAKGEYGIELCVNVDSTRADYIDALRSYFAEMQVPLVSRGAEPHRRPAMLCVDLGLDVDEAHTRFCEIVDRIGGAAVDGEYRYRFSEMAPGGQLIDGPEFLSGEDFDRLQEEAIRDVTGEPRSRLVRVAMFLTMSLCGTLGLAYSLISRGRGESLPHLEIPGLGVSPGLLDVVCMALIVLGYSAVFTRSYWFMVQSQLERDIGLPVEPRQGRDLLLHLFPRPMPWAHALLIVLTVYSWLDI